MDYIKLLRIKHYIKNGLILLPLIFSGNLFNLQKLIASGYGFIAFCLISSTVYIINDLQDIEADRKHEVKKNRPLASGRVSKKNAWLLAIICFILSILFSSIMAHTLKGTILVMIYLVLNILYSKGLKQVPILDIAILVSGFLIRVLFGAVIINEEVSYWLYLTVMSMAFYLSLGKRRNELKKLGDRAKEVRGVLQHYNQNFLDKNMYICLALTVVFYALWSIDLTTIARLQSESLIWTVPIVMLICMRYSLVVETEIYADPVDILTGDKSLFGLVILYGVMMLGIIYILPIFKMVSVL